MTPTTTLSIGRTAGGERFALPADVVTLTTAILGIRGSGKTNTGGVISEELLTLEHQINVIDPLDAWWGLKSSADGKSKGFPVVVLGGPHGDLPLTEDDGATIADFAVEHRVSLILSLRHLRKGAQRRFVTEFAEQLYHRKGEVKNRTPMNVMIDEASSFVPQKVGGAEARMVGAIEDLVRRGRSSGLGVTLIDQRPASVNKDVLTQLQVLICHQVTSPQDSKALDAWVSQHDAEDNRDDFMAKLPILKTGEAWFWAPSLDLFERVQVRARKTFDSSKTPKLGEVPRAPEKVAAVDLEALKSKLASTIEEARANDPKLLHARIAELEREVEALATVEALDGADAKALQDMQAQNAGLRADVEELYQQRDAAVASLTEAVRSHNDALDQIWSEVKRVMGNAPHLRLALPEKDRLPMRGSSFFDVEEVQHPPRTVEARARPAPIQRQHETTGSRTQGKVAGGPLKILGALARLESIGRNQSPRSIVAWLAGYSASGGGFRNYLGALRTDGLIEYPTSDEVALTASGRKAAPTVHRAPTRRELHDQVLAMLGGGERRILERLIWAYPGSLTRQQLASDTGFEPTGGGFRNYLGKLRTLGIADYPSSDSVIATDLLFPKGLR